MILRCLKIGLSLSDMDNISIGFILDLVEENNSEASQVAEPTEATTDILYKFFK